MVKQDTEIDVAAPRRVRTSGAVQHNQAGSPDKKLHTAQYVRRDSEPPLIEDNRRRPGSSKLALRSTTVSDAEIGTSHFEESNMIPPSEPTNFFPNGSSSASDYLSDDDQVEMPVFDKSDLFILVMGVTGAGKSTFISLLTDEDIEIGHGLRSNTKQVSFYGLRRSSGRRVWLVDTPGFDDTERGNLDLLKDLIECLVMLDERGGRIGAILYLHRITDPRMGGSSVRSLAIFKLLVGAGAMPLVRLVSTRWNDVNASASNLARAEAVEKQLCTTERFWGSCIAEGALTLRHRDDQASAEAVVASIIEKTTAHNIRLSIVKELRDNELPLAKTGVGNFISEDNNKLAQQYETEIANLKQEQQTAFEEQERELAQQLAAEEREFQRRAEQIARVEKELAKDYVRRDDSVAWSTAARGSTKREKKSRAPPPPPMPQRTTTHHDEVIAHLSRKQRQERRALENRLMHEREKNRRDERRRPQGLNRFFNFLRNGHNPC